jgi:hypothetical protein
MRDDFNRTTTGSGWSGGPMLAILAAILVIGALFMWMPSSGDSSASNSSSGTTVGQTRTAPAPVTPGPAGTTTTR